ncbi:MAG TPA: hypothetical protein VJU84_14730 [Pyrinomonadaceae bacterium]|nr:hypothetical protein [Pyrinomonadaceae bacterium]
MLYILPLRPLVFVGLLVVVAACVMLPSHTTNARRVGITPSDVRNDGDLAYRSTKNEANEAVAISQKEAFYYHSRSPLIAYAPPPAFNGYNYQRTLTIDHNKIPNTDQVNFPVLISGTYSYLAMVSNGGYVQNAQRLRCNLHFRFGMHREAES